MSAPASTQATMGIHARESMSSQLKVKTAKKRHIIKTTVEIQACLRKGKG